MDGISVLVSVASATVTATATAKGKCTATGPDHIHCYGDTEVGQLRSKK